MEERTALPRGRVLLAGKIVFNAGRSSIDCTIRNLFESGAYVEIRSPIGVPSHFDLVIGANGEVRPCKLEWQTAQRLGLSFISGESVSKGSDRVTRAPDQ